MSTELFVILIVALLVFSPKKIPMLAHHLGILWRQVNVLKMQLTGWWQQQLQQIQLEENKRKADEADKIYRHKVE